MTKLILRFEGLAFFLLFSFAHFQSGGNWTHYIFFMILPDASFVGYLFGNKAGAVTYNIVHNYVLALVLFFIGSVTDWQSSQLVFFAGLALMAHIGLDRFLKLGLKEFRGFQHTHLGTIGKRP